MKKEENKKIIRAAIYIRVSTDEQAKHGYSLEAQTNNLKEFCNTKNYKIVGIYADEGKTARSKLSNRKELLRLIDDIKEGKIDRIVFWRLDRWFRNIADYYKIQSILDNYKVDWECSDEEYDTYTSNGRLYLNIKLSIAQNESDQTSDRIKFNFSNMVKNKRPIFGTQSMPPGYKIVGERKDKKIIKDESNENFVYDMFETFERLNSVGKTCKYLNEKYNLDKDYSCYYRYLTNEFYTGVYRDIDNYCEPYITKERFDNIQNIIKINLRDNTKKRDYIFQGLIRCPNCKRKMNGWIRRNKKLCKDGTIHKYYHQNYRCQRCWVSGLCDNKRCITEKNIEKWLLEHFFEELNKYVISIENIAQNLKNTPIINTKKLEDKLERLNYLFLNGRTSKELYEEQYNSIINELNQIKAEDVKEKDVSKYKQILRNTDALDLYSNLTSENKRAFWAKYIDYIEEIPGKINEFRIFFK